MADGALGVVTLNIQFALRIEQARQLFARRPELLRADLVLLQEMDPEGTERLASALDMRFVYHPSCVHPTTGRWFGNAVLSRFPIVRDRKLELSHESLCNSTRRSATCATVATPAGELEVCSVHLATRFEQFPRARRDQMREVVRELRGASHVVLGGDCNSYRIGALAVAGGLDWVTRDLGGPLRCVFAIDHLFTRGLRTRAVGRVTDTSDATDHPAVWAQLAWA
jgi:endonuclease/exonuclease/phosphatase family metal-dependent hydrolase